MSLQSHNFAAPYWANNQVETALFSSPGFVICDCVILKVVQSHNLHTRCMAAPYWANNQVETAADFSHLFDSSSCPFNSTISTKVTWQPPWWDKQSSWDSTRLFSRLRLLSSGIWWDYFHTMVLCQIPTRYDPTSRITSCVREIRESAGNAFREPFSEISGRWQVGGWGGVNPVCNPLPLLGARST